MPHGWHKSAVEMYLPVLNEREPDQVTSVGQPLLQCHPGLVYAAGHTHHPWHRGVSDPDNSGTPLASGQPPVNCSDCVA